MNQVGGGVGLPGGAVLVVIEVAGVGDARPLHGGKYLLLLERTEGLLSGPAAVVSASAEESDAGKAECGVLSPGEILRHTGESVGVA